MQQALMRWNPWPALGRLALLAMVLAGGWTSAQAQGGPNASHASLLAEGQLWRSIPFTLRDGLKPMLAARVGDTVGVLMLDNGTPDALFLNRDATALAPGPVVGRGSAASGQVIEVHTHPMPAVWVDGVALAAGVGPSVRSGNFQFTAAGLGADFLGFIGTPMLAHDALVLDHARRLATVIRVQPGGQLAVPPPAAADVRLTTPFFLWPGEQPTLVGTLGAAPLLIDFDTGDEGTVYLSAATQAQLQRRGLLRRQSGAAHAPWRLAGLRIGGVGFAPLDVRVLQAGGPEDHRTVGHADQLRLGASFLASHPVVWNFPAKSLTFLKPNAAFLGSFSKGSLLGP